MNNTRPKELISESRNHPLQQKRQSAVTSIDSSRLNIVGEFRGKDDYEKTIFDDWDQPPKQFKKTQEKFNSAIAKITEKHGGFPEFKLSHIPTHRTEKH